MSKSARSKDVRTPLARFAYTKDLFKARPQDDGTEKFGCTLLFPKSDSLKELKEAALEAAKLKWGAEAESMIANGLIKSPFLDGDGAQGFNKKTNKRHAGFEGHTFIRVSSGKDYPPRVVGRNPKLDCPQEEFYSGVFGYAVVNAVAWHHEKSGNGISFSISLAQKAKDGERLGGGGADPSKYFDTIEDEGAAPAETTGGSGAAGLFG